MNEEARARYARVVEAAGAAIECARVLVANAQAVCMASQELCALQRERKSEGVETRIERPLVPPGPLPPRD